MELTLLIGVTLGAVAAALWSALSVSRVSNVHLRKAIALGIILLGIGTGLWVLVGL